MSEPLGSLCVLRDDDLSGWTVYVCHGVGKRELVARFATKGEADTRALAERDRRRAANLGDYRLCIQSPEDCPCNGQEIP